LKSVPRGALPSGSIAQGGQLRALGQSLTASPRAIETVIATQLSCKCTRQGAA
jgi:hypothetical protein